MIYDPQTIHSTMEALLRAGIKYDQESAFQWLRNELIERI